MDWTSFVVDLLKGIVNLVVHCCYSIEPFSASGDENSKSSERFIVLGRSHTGFDRVSTCGWR